MTSLLQSPLTDLVQRQKLVTVSQNDTVAATLEKLSTYQLLCAPVVNETDAKLVGFVDVIDIMTFLIPCCTKHTSSETPKLVGGPEWFSEDDIAGLPEKTNQFKMAQVMSIISMHFNSISDSIDRSGNDPAHTLKASSTVMDAIQKYLKGVHRIAVTDDNGKPIGLVSQCTILQNVVEQKDPVLQEMMKVRVKETPFKSGFVQTVLETESAINALLLMKSRNVPDLPIVDKAGKVTGIISASDVRCFVAGDFRKLLMPVNQFVCDIRRKLGKPYKFCVRCMPHETVGDALNKMVLNKVHRVVLIDERNKPTGVISMTDIMKALTSALLLERRS